MANSAEPGGSAVKQQSADGSSETTTPPVQVKKKKVEEASSGLVEGSRMHKAAVEIRSAVVVQRLYRGYRARRNIADAATMAHKFGWWNVVDGAMLDYNSSQFYAYHTPQNAAQRWLRLKKKAAKVGKGLSKDEKARKLALQHWLEAIDPRHRYGHNLHFYYEKWHSSQTREPFFYWLDIGEGKELDLEKCSRSKLQKELIRYLSPKERKWYEVVIEDGKLVYKMTWEPVNTPKGHKWIFVMSTSGKLYVGKKEKGKLQHSSFVAGGATTAAGRLLVKDGIIQLMEAHSGHYHPTPQNFQQLIDILTRSGADLTFAKVQFVSDDMLGPSSSMKSEKDLTKSEKSVTEATEEDVSVVSEDGLKEDHVIQKLEYVTSEDGQDEQHGSLRKLVSLSLEDEENTSCVKVTQMEGSVPEYGKDGYLEVEAESGAESIEEIMEGMKLEILKPSKESQSCQDQVAGEESGKSLRNDVSATSSELSQRPKLSHHHLYSPAMQTFSKMDRSQSLQVRSTWNS